VVHLDFLLVENFLDFVKNLLVSGYFASSNVGKVFFDDCEFVFENTHAFEFCVAGTLQVFGFEVLVVAEKVFNSHFFGFTRFDPGFNVLEAEADGSVFLECGFTNVSLTRDVGPVFH